MNWQDEQLLVCTKCFTQFTALTAQEKNGCPKCGWLRFLTLEQYERQQARNRKTGT